MISGISAKIAKMKSGKKLSDEQRNQLKSAMKTIIDAADTKYNEGIKDMKLEFDDRGLDASVYIPVKDIKSAEQKQSSAP